MTVKILWHPTNKQMFTELPWLIFKNFPCPTDELQLFPVTICLLENLYHCLNVVLLLCGLIQFLFRTEELLLFPHYHAELRCDKVMDTFSGCGLCLPNLTHLSPCHFGDLRPPLCVEIKVKIIRHFKSIDMTLCRQLTYAVKCHKPLL